MHNSLYICLYMEICNILIFVWTSNSTLEICNANVIFEEAVECKLLCTNSFPYESHSIDNINH